MANARWRLLLIPTGLGFGCGTSSSPSQSADRYPAIVAVLPFDAVPENLLRVNVTVSTPVAEGQLPPRVHLYDDAGHEVQDVFFQPQHELWSPDRLHLTLLLDPSRVKTRLAVHERLGRALRTGDTMVLTIDPGWTDLYGAIAATEVRVPLVVLPEDRSMEPLAAWQVTPPAVDSTEALRISFPEPLDAAGLRAFLIVIDAHDEPVPGALGIEEGGRSWTFRPHAPWRPGTYQVVVDPRIEDLAGNNLMEGMEQAVGQQSVRPAAHLRRLPFVVGER